MQKPLSNTQIVVFTLIWVITCFFILTSSARLDGPLILSIFISGALVFIPIVKSLKSRKK